MSLICSYTLTGNLVCLPIITGDTIDNVKAKI